MPLFISDEELQRIGGDVAAVVAKAEDFAKDLFVQIETQKARADAAVINAEQTCRLLEQKYVALMSQVSQLENERSQAAASLENKASELSQVQTQMNELKLQLMKRDADFESQALEMNELRKSRKEMLDVIEKKNLELDEKNTSSKQYLEKVLALNEEKSNLESKVHELMAELTRSRTQEARIGQEKDITMQHNNWLNQELTTKVNNLLEERQRNAQVEAELQARVLESERVAREKEAALSRSQDRVKELESELHALIEELRFVKEDAAAKEEHLATEVTTASKLAELYKQSSEEWSRKANELEGVIKALEVHLNQCKTEYEEKLRKEIEARESLKKEFAEAKASYERRILEMQEAKTTDSGFFELDNGRFITGDDNSAVELHGNEVALPKFPYGVSGTALAATLLRDGWTLGTVYSKYQEAVDAWRHERHERSRSQALLDRVLHEVEDKAAMILAERAEYTRMVEAYGIMEEKLKLSISDQTTLEISVKDLKAELRKKDRELKGALKDISDLQTQVSVLLKECLDVQKRHGLAEDSMTTEDLPGAPPVADVSSADAVISDKLLTFKDIHGMVEHNTQLRALVRVLAEQNEKKEQELKEEFDARLKLRIDEASEKVNEVLKRAEEQNHIIESLQGTVGMYKRLYEEERSIRSTFAVTPGSPRADERRHDLKRLLDLSQDEFRRQLDAANEKYKSLEEELAQTRLNLSAARAECARAEAEAAFSKGKLSSVTRESEGQRNQMEAVLSRNVELSQMINDYQRKLRESSQTVQIAEQQARKLSIEVSVLEREKELLANAEKRAALEASQLSERVHRLQATVDTIQSTAEVREVSKATEKRKLEEDVTRMQREWVEAKHQLELERNFVRSITAERDKAIERTETLNVELKGALSALTASEIRAKVAEARCSELEASLKRADEKIMTVIAGGKKVTGSEDTDDQLLRTLQQSREEIEILREELNASKTHAEQYKHIAQANEEALKKMEQAHSRFKEEAAKTKDVMDSELKLLQKHLSDVESLSLEKEKEAGEVQANKESLLRNALKEVALLKDAEASKQALFEQAEERIKVLKEDLEKQHNQWREAQNNYERQVMLQADTIRELNLANERLASLEQQEKQLLAKAESAETELESVKVTFFMEKASLEAEKLDMEKRLKEVEEQNRILLDRLEARHITLAEQERRASLGGETPGEAKEETELQSVVHYLRRAKEAADTEISLLKQERARLNKQFEAASRAAEDAQAKLRQHHENLRASLYTDEEFRALQAQVMEMNLLRENNVQLREENKRIYEENKDLRERFCKLEENLEALKRALREKDVELEANRNEIESLKADIRRWQQRVSQMIEKYKALDVEDYERVKQLLLQTQERVRQVEFELESAKKDAFECREKMSNYEQEVALKTENLAVAERKLEDAQKAEVQTKGELERMKRICQQLKRKLEAVNREKETIHKELEDHKSGKRFVLEAVHQEALEASQKEAAARLEAQKESIMKETVQRYENTQREKDTRIQILEHTLNKERDELKKEKIRRERDRKTFLDLSQKAKEEKQRCADELQHLRQENDQIRQMVDVLQQSQAAGNVSTELSKVEPEPYLKSFQTTVDQLSEVVRVQVESELVLPPATSEALPAPEAVQLAAKPNPLPVVKPVVRPALVTSAGSGTLETDREREIQELRASIFEKERTQTRRSGRRIVRPRIEPSNQLDSANEATETVVDVAGEGAPEVEAEPRVSEIVDLIDAAAPSNAPAAHKRSSSESLDGEQSLMQQEVRSDMEPPQKKARNNELSTDAAETEAGPSQEEPTTQASFVTATEEDAGPDNGADAVARTSELLDDIAATEDATMENAEIPDYPKSPIADVPQVEEAEQGHDQGQDQTETVPTMEIDAGVLQDTDIVEGGEFPADVEDGEISLGVAEEAGGEGDFEHEHPIDDQKETTANLSTDDMKPDDGGHGTEAVPEKVETETIASSSAAAPAPANTTIHIQERARERRLQRHKDNVPSPPSPGGVVPGRGRARGVRGLSKTGRRGGRGSGRGNI